MVALYSVPSETELPRIQRVILVIKTVVLCVVYVQLDRQGEVLLLLHIERKLA